MADESGDVWVDSIDKYSATIEPAEPDNNPRWVEALPGEQVPHMYNDPRNEQTAFGGVKKKDNANELVRRMKQVLADPESTEEDKKEARKNLLDNDLCLKVSGLEAEF